VKTKFKCCGCGAVFHATDGDRCVACAIAKADGQQVHQQPAKRNGHRCRGILLESELNERGALAQPTPYGQRLADGFRMLNGEILTR